MQQVTSRRPTPAFSKYATHQLHLTAVQESDQLQEPQPTSSMTPRSSQAKELSAPTPASTPVAGAASRFQMGHSEKTADPAVGKQEDAALGGAPDKPLTSAFAGAASIESAPDSERTSLSGGPAGSGMESRWVLRALSACGAAKQGEAWAQREGCLRLWHPSAASAAGSHSSAFRAGQQFRCLRSALGGAAGLLHGVLQ